MAKLAILRQICNFLRKLQIGLSKIIKIKKVKRCHARYSNKLFILKSKTHTTTCLLFLKVRGASRTICAAQSFPATLYSRLSAKTSIKKTRIEISLSGQLAVRIDAIKTMNARQDSSVRNLIT